MKKTILSLLALTVGFSAQAMDSQTYKVTITNNWNRADHAGFPNSAHFSPVVSASHNTGYELFPIGAKASAGFEMVAEVGQAGDLENEIRRARTAGNVFKKNVTRNQFVNPNNGNFRSSQSFNIEVSKAHPFLSFVSMIAPSPDWVVGISNLELYSEKTGFADGIKNFELFAYDAGTEDGDRAGNFSINNSPTRPQGKIRVLRGRGFDEPFATVTIEKM